MKKSAAVLCVLLLVTAICLIAGCSSSSPKDSSTPSAQAGFSSGSGIATQTARYPLDVAIQYVKVRDWSGDQVSAPAGGNTQKTIRYVHGVDLDEQGDAVTWMIVVEQGGRNTMVTFMDDIGSATGTPILPSWTTINTSQIQTPSQLFEKNHGAIFNESQTAIVSRDISLEEGNYILTLNGKSGTQTLVFNATTGVLIS